MVPAESSPGMYGKVGRRLYEPERMYVSTGLTPAAYTRIKTYRDISIRNILQRLFCSSKRTSRCWMLGIGTSLISWQTLASPLNDKKTRIINFESIWLFTKFFNHNFTHVTHFENCTSRINQWISFFLRLSFVSSVKYAFKSFVGMKRPIQKSNVAHV